MKIISKVKIHPLFYLFAIICILNGLFKDFMIIMFIITIHELGHIITGFLYKWNIKKIVVLPIGGITIFECLLNTKLKEEFLVAIMGPVFQFSLFLIDNPKLLFYNKLLIIFNLIPIIPLDGSKIINVLLNKLFSFKKSYIITNIISVILIIILLYFSNDLMELIIITLLIIKIIESVKKNKYIFNKFLFERYLYNFKFKKNRIIKSNNLSKMKKEYKHLFYIDKNYKTEKELLNKMFDK